MHVYHSHCSSVCLYVVMHACKYIHIYSVCHDGALILGIHICSDVSSSWSDSERLQVIFAGVSPHKYIDIRTHINFKAHSAIYK